MSGINYTDEMAEEIIKEIPEGVEESAAEEKVSVSKKPKKKYSSTLIKKNVGVKCSSSKREASYDSDAQQLTITQNGITIMVSPCKTEKQAIRLAAKF
tara:strand:- start:617 stop:910 length:294 start_codon:yes stop_codon:yes gene_type:complete